MTATYTFDVFSSLDGYGAAGGDWTGYWGKQGPELLESGVDSREIVRRMVATGDWSEAGAVGFVSFLTHGLDAPASPGRVEHPGRRGDSA